MHAPLPQLTIIRLATCHRHHGWHTEVYLLTLISLPAISLHPLLVCLATNGFLLTHDQNQYHRLLRAATHTSGRDQWCGAQQSGCVTSASLNPLASRGVAATSFITYKHCAWLLCFSDRWRRPIGWFVIIFVFYTGYSFVIMLIVVFEWLIIAVTLLYMNTIWQAQPESISNSWWQHVLSEYVVLVDRCLDLTCSLADRCGLGPGGLLLLFGRPGVRACRRCRSVEDVIYTMAFQYI